MLVSRPGVKAEKGGRMCGEEAAVYPVIRLRPVVHSLFCAQGGRTGHTSLLTFCVPFLQQAHFSVFNYSL